VIVVKCGGAAGVAPAGVCAGVAAAVAAGEQVVLVHGGSAEIARLAERLGVPQRELVAPNGMRSRYTDPATMEVIRLALLGQVRPALLVELGRLGVPAIGLSGLDAGLLRARRKKVLHAVVGGRTVLVRDDQSGRIAAVDGGLLRTLMLAGITPVVSPPAVAEDGAPVNVNADRVAAAVAGVLSATRLLLLTSAPGLLADAQDEGSVLAEVELAPDGPLPPSGPGMAVKLIAVKEALLAGVPEVVIADGRVEHAVERAMAGAGTRLRLAAPRRLAPLASPAVSADTP